MKQVTVFKPIYFIIMELYCIWAKASNYHVDKIDICEYIDSGYDSTSG